MAAGLFATQHPELVDRIVFFGPVTRREIMKGVPPLGPWRFLTTEEQHNRFVEDVPADEPVVLLDRNFADWSALYLKSDPSSGTRTPPSVKTPNGPVAERRGEHRSRWGDFTALKARRFSDAIKRSSR